MTEALAALLFRDAGEDTPGSSCAFIVGISWQ